jgi:Ca2+-binding EF-hand superfamily protein
MVRLTQKDVAACREAFALHDGDAARLRAMMLAVNQPVSDEVVMDMCSEVAVARPLHAALGEHAESGLAVSAAADSSGAASFEVLLRMVEQQCQGAEDAEEDTRLAFAALGGGIDGTGRIDAAKMKSVCKARALTRTGGLARVPGWPCAAARTRR